MATKSDDMFSRLFSGDKPAAQDAPKREPKPKLESEAQPKPKAKPRKQGPQKPAKVDGSQLFGPTAENERKSARIQMLVKESDNERWRNAAKSYGVSLTRFIETVLNDYCDRNDL